MRICHYAMRPRVSCVITAFNGEAFVAEAIESVLSQTRPVDELLVIDDGSTDGTAEIVVRYSPRGVRLIRQENRGLARARNRGIAEATGDLITFLDCDDLWVPEKTELQLRGFDQNPWLGLVTCDVWWWEFPGHRRYVKPQRIGGTPSAVRRELAVRNSVGNASGVMIHRRVFDEVGGFDPEQIWAEDWELWMRIAERFPISIVHRPLMVYRTVSTSLTQQKRWARSNGYYQLSRAAIGKVQPRFWRPILTLRAWSWREYCRAGYAYVERLPRSGYLWHATLALLSWPFELTQDKLRHWAHALFGDWLAKLYRSLRPRTAQQIGG